MVGDEEVEAGDGLVELLGADFDPLRRPQLLVLHVIDLHSQVLSMR